MHGSKKVGTSGHGIITATLIKFSRRLRDVLPRRVCQATLRGIPTPRFRSAWGPIPLRSSAGPPLLSAGSLGRSVAAAKLSIARDENVSNLLS